MAKREWAGRVELSAALYEAGLSEWAQRSTASRGRERMEAPCTLRTPFQRDRDRIVHSKSFRRSNTRPKSSSHPRAITTGRA